MARFFFFEVFLIILLERKGRDTWGYGVKLLKTNGSDD
jgi:hypothetical protein